MNWPNKKPLLFCFSLLLLFPLFGQTQEMHVDKADDGRGSYWLKWDATQKRFVAYRNTRDASAPGAQLYSEEGHGLPIYPIRDLAESHAVNVWDAAATPEGGIVMTAFVEYGTADKHYPVKSDFLTYGAAGELKKVWDVSPYEFDLVAVDSHSNVYALGSAELDEPYFLIVKYSPEGKVLRQFLSTSLFSQGDHILSPGGGTKGQNRMFIEADTLFVWLARTEELLRFSLNGDLLGRVSLARPLRQLAAAAGNDGVVLRSLATGDGGGVVAQVITWDTRKSRPVTTSRFVFLPLDGSVASALPIDADRTQLLGRSANGKLLIFEPISRTVKEY
jgi:hypothetical protein